MKKHTFIREKTLSRYACCYKKVDWIEYSNEEQQAVRKTRRTKTRASPPKIKNLNDSYSRQYFEWLLNNNFHNRDYHVTLTFSNAPTDKKETKREFDNYIKRVRRLYMKNGVVFKYLYVTGHATKSGRLHYHIVMSGGVPRDDIENLWHLGYANADRLRTGYVSSDQMQPPEPRLFALSNYLTRSQGRAEKYERTWNCSQNLKRPDKIIDDNRITKRQMRKLQEAKRNNEAKSYLERIYKGWRVIDCDIGYNPVTGRPYAHIKLIRNDTG